MFQEMKSKMYVKYYIINNILMLILIFIYQIESAKAWGAAIKVSQTLERLHLNACALAGESFAAIADGLKDNKSIEYLSLDGNTKLGKTTFPEVSK